MRETLNSINLNKKLIFIVVGIIGYMGILYFLPNHPIDPWNLFNPFRFGVLIAVLATIQFIGHIAIQLFGKRLGMIILGFLGGLISSTVVIATLPKIIEDNRELLKPAIGAAIFANIGMLTELGTILYITAPALIKYMAIPFGSMIITGIIISVVFVNLQHKSTPLSSSLNSFDFKSVLKLGLLLAFMIFTIGLIQQKMGNQALMMAAFFGGFFEIHSVSLGAANLFADNVLPLHQALVFLSLAILASHLSKFILLGILARNKFGFYTALSLFLMLFTGGVSLWLIY